MRRICQLTRFEAGKRFIIPSGRSVCQKGNLHIVTEALHRRLQLRRRRAAFPDTVRCGLGCRENQAMPQLMHSGATLGILDGCDWGISRSE